MLATLMLAAMAATPCEALKAVSLTNATITAAEFVPEGVYTPLASARGGPPATGADIIAPAHCRVIAVLRPSPDSLINMELWLPPADQWNGKFEAVGNGGWAGSI